MKRTGSVTGAILITAILAVRFAVLAEGNHGKEDDALTQALQSAQLPLEGGLSASLREGTPISAKYEMDKGTIQLSVYTVKDGTFSEVIVDHATGNVGKSDTITDNDDLAAARSQNAAMEKAKRSLEAATAETVKIHSGYRAVSVVPVLKDGRQVAEVTLLNGTEWKTVSATLD